MDIKDITIIQPNNITFASYNLTAFQENILTLIIEALQKHMTHHSELQTDLFQQPYVEISCDDAGGRNNKSKVIAEANEMLHKKFSFKWTHPEIHKAVETHGTIITTIHEIRGSNRMAINFNPWAIPFLVYYGVEVGGTKFNKTIALTLKGSYTKRIFKMICRWRDKPFFVYKISDFIKDLDITKFKAYQDNVNLRRRILEPAKQSIQSAQSDIWFDYELVTRTKTPGKKPKHDTIIFKIYKADAVAEKDKVSIDIYVYVYNLLSCVWNKSKSSKSLDIVDKLNEQGKLQNFYDRLKKLEKKFNGTKNILEVPDYIKLVKHILKTDYDFDVTGK